MSNTLEDLDERPKAIEEVLQRIRDDNPQAVYAVVQDEAGRYSVVLYGRQFGLGIAASILQAEFAKEWG